MLSRPTPPPREERPIPVIDTVAQRTVSLEGATRPWLPIRARILGCDVQRRPSTNGSVHGADSGLVNNLKAISSTLRAVGLRTRESWASVAISMRRLLPLPIWLLWRSPAGMLSKRGHHLPEGTGEPRRRHPGCRDLRGVRRGQVARDQPRVLCPVATNS